MESYYFFFILAIVALLLTYAIRIVAIKRNVIDVPNERSSHTIPTPRGGGLAIVICWFIGLGVFQFKGLIDSSLFYALSSGIILAVIGVLDDILSLKPSTRLIFQLLTAIIAVYFLGGFNLHFTAFSSTVLQLLVSAIVVVGIIWFVNLYNFLDGIDAYASIEAVFISFALFFFTKSLIPLLLLAPTLGFLFWNWPKAKIFMGDVGSTQLGFILVILGIYFHNNLEFNFLNWLMLSSIFWFDASFTLFRRWRNKEKLSQAHKKHAYQRIVQAGFSHLKTDIFAFCINIIILSLVYISIEFPFLTIPSFIITIILLFAATFKIDSLFPFSKNK